MAGKFVTILNPGYSTLYTRDLPYTVSANVEGASANVFNPDDTNPLQEGEWLTFTGDGKLQRVVGTLTSSDSYDSATPSALEVATTSGGTELAATSPCFMYFQERGRYDAQLTRKAHVIMGPSNFEFRTKMVVCGGEAEVGERVYVMICKDSAGRLVSALATDTAIGSVVTLDSTHWYAGIVTQFHGVNDVTILFQPGFGV